MFSDTFITKLMSKSLICFIKSIYFIDVYVLLAS